MGRAHQSLPPDMRLLLPRGEVPARGMGTVTHRWQDFGEVLSTRSCRSPLASLCYERCSCGRPFQKQERSEEPHALRTRCRSQVRRLERLLRSLPSLLLAWRSPGARPGAKLWSVPCEVTLWA